ncbi:MAG: hypothetical protein NZM35_04855 [Chitinophagales bacterium]|nr:hypothetical protein [Chitinophagales bacterium]MDW8419219.1 hypothetical protein [Chitinophagales bacterium]
MAKQTNKPAQQKVKHTATSQSSPAAFTYIFRNVVIVVAFGLLLLIIDGYNRKQRELPELTKEFYALRESGSNQQRLMELYNRIVEIQTDTSFLTRVLRGYNFAVHDVAIGGKESVRRAKEEIRRLGLDSTAKSLYDAKMNMRVGLYPFFQYVVQNTPEDAVIFIPKGDSALSNNPKYNFIYELEWTEFFIYPRLCLNIGDEDKQPELARRATHVMIVDGRGYEKLKYHIPPEQRPRDAILPIHQPPAGINNP